MKTFEIYCSTIQCFDDIESLCLRKSFVLAKNKVLDGDIVIKAVMKCKELKVELQTWWKNNSLMQKQCQLFSGSGYRRKIDNMRQQFDSILKKEQADREYFNTLFKEAYRPAAKYAYENDYPADEPRASFLMWEKNVNPYRDLQSIKKKKAREKVFNLSETSALFSEFRRILEKETSSESLVKKIRELFLTYDIFLD